MSEFEFEVFLNYTSLVDYCRTFNEECDLTRELVDQIHSESGRLVAAKASWKRTGRAVTNMQRLLKHLRDQATEYLRRESDSVEEYISDILNYDSLQSQSTLPFGLNEEYIPDESELRSMARQDGLEQIREYTDTHLNLCNTAYRSLDRKIDRRLDDAERISWTADAALSQFADSDILYEDLKEAYVWSIDYSDCGLIARKSSNICQNREDFYNRIKTNPDDPRIKVYSPEEVLDQI